MLLCIQRANQVDARAIIFLWQFFFLNYTHVKVQEIILYNITKTLDTLIGAVAQIDGTQYTNLSIEILQEVIEASYILVELYSRYTQVKSVNGLIRSLTIRIKLLTETVKNVYCS